jgi:hypothetical protein
MLHPASQHHHPLPLPPWAVSGSIALGDIPQLPAIAVGLLASLAVGTFAMRGRGEVLEEKTAGSDNVVITSPVVVVAAVPNVVDGFDMGCRHPMFLFHMMHWLGSNMINGVKCTMRVPLMKQSMPSLKSSTKQLRV